MKSILRFLSFLVLAAPTFAQVYAEREYVKPPQAALPDEARRSGLGGTLRVLVEVDASGKIVGIRDVKGPDWVCPAVARPDVLALRQAARAAAEKIEFAPTANGTGTPNSLVWIPVDFPRKEPTGEDGEGVQFSAEPEKGQSNSGTPVAKSERFTVRGDSNYSAEKAPSPDYIGPVAAGDTEVSAGEQIKGGILNGKAILLLKPKYPPAARAVRAEGAVSVQVVIDEDGKVFSSEPVSGHPLLREASRIAACGSEFSPTLLSGNPVKVSGIITYNFVP